MSVRGIVAGVVFLGLASGAYAQEAGIAPEEAPVEPERKGWYGFVTLGAGITPDYYGSDDYEAAAAVFAQLNYDEYFLRLRPELAGAGVLELSANVMPDVVPFGRLNLGPLIQYRQGRGDVQNDKVDDLSNIDPAIEAGGFIEYSFPVSDDPRQRLAFELKGAADVSNAHDGALLGIRSRYSQPITQDFLMIGEAFSHYGTEEFMSTYFGINSANATRSGLDRYNADGDFRNIGFALVADYEFIEHWSVTTVGAYSRLLGDAEDSPIVDDVGSPNLFFASVGVTYSFGF